MTVGGGDGLETLNLSSKALGLRSKIVRLAASISSPCKVVLWQAWHLQVGPQVVLEAKHWQYSLRHLCLNMTKKHGEMYEVQNDIIHCTREPKGSAE